MRESFIRLSASSLAFFKTEGVCQSIYGLDSRDGCREFCVRDIDNRVNDMDGIYGRNRKAGCSVEGQKRKIVPVLDSTTTLPPLISICSKGLA